MLGMTIVICVFLFMTTALILSSVDKRTKTNNELLEILDNLNRRTKDLEEGFKLGLDVSERQNKRLEDLENK